MDYARPKPIIDFQEHPVARSSERARELRRRRSRTKKLGILERKVAKATISEKAHMAGKIRKMTIGAEEIIGRLKLIEQR